MMQSVVREQAPTTATPYRRRRSRGRRIRGSIGRAAAGWLVTLLFLFPIIALVATSLKSEAAAYGTGFFLKFKPTFAEYTGVFTQHSITPYLLQSVLVSLMCAVAVVILSVMAAYALVFGRISRVYDFLFFFVSTKALPTAAAVIPIYLAVKSLNQLNEPWILGVLYIGFNLPIGIWIIWSSVKDIPVEIIEAARVDGTGPLRMLWSMILPIAAGGIASAGLLCFVFAWGEFLFALSLTTTNSTLPVFLTGFESYGEPYIALLSAAAVVISIPPVIAGWLSQRYLVRSLGSGSK